MDLTQFAIWRVTIICALVGSLIAAEETFVQTNWKPCGGTAKSDRCAHFIDPFVLVFFRWLSIASDCREYSSIRANVSVSEWN